MHFVVHAIFFLKKKTRQKKKNWIRPYLPWSDTSHVMLSAHWHPNLSGIIQNPNSVFFCLLEGTKMVQPPAVTEASFYLAAVSLNTKKNRRRCSLLHWCTTDVRVMHGASLLSWLSVSGFITGEKEIVTAKVNPQKISPYIKSTVWSYLPCCVTNCERDLFTQTLVTHLSPLSKSTLTQTRASS